MCMCHSLSERGRVGWGADYMGKGDKSKKEQNKTKTKKREKGRHETFNPLRGDGMDMSWTASAAHTQARRLLMGAPTFRSRAPLPF